jgi:hypothetical protein
MDLEEIKQNLRFRSGRTNMSKRFPTRKLERKETLQPPTQAQKSSAPRKERKPFVNGADTVPTRKEAPRPASSNLCFSINDDSEHFRTNRKQLTGPDCPRVKS